MNRLILLAALSLGAVRAQGETMQQWVEAAPQAEVGFAPWETSSNSYGEGLRLAQGIYGHVDLSKLPKEDFPIRVRLLYTPAQSDAPSSDVKISSDFRYALPVPGASA